MKALPFPCIRPAAEHVIDVVSGAVDVLASADALRDALADGVMVKDPGAAFYLYQRATQDGAQTGVACICSLDDLATASLSNAGDDLEEASAREAGRISALGMQSNAVVAEYAAQPVLDIILGAAMQGAAIYDLFDGAGARHRLWEVKRRDAVDAIHTMLESMSIDTVLTPAALAAAEADREMKAALAAKDGGVSGKEPFNYALTVLFPKGSAVEAGLPHGWLLHQMAKL